ncbi:protein O-mannosyl-transferase TMTC1-like [Mustelus asterias]
MMEEAALGPVASTPFPTCYANLPKNEPLETMLDWWHCSRLVWLRSIVEGLAFRGRHLAGLGHLPNVDQPDRSKALLTLPKWEHRIIGYGFNSRLHAECSTQGMLYYLSSIVQTSQLTDAPTLIQVPSLGKLKHREVLVGLLFLVFPFIPASNLFFRVGFVVAERVLYMPSMGYCILVVHGLNRLCGVLSKWGASVVTVSTLLVLGLFFWKTLKQNEVWLSRESLFRSGVQTLPLNAKVHYNYANFLKDYGRHDEAVYHYKTALMLYPRHASALNNLGTLTKDVSEAEVHYRQALELNPQHNRALFNLGNLLKSQKKLLEAERLLRDSVRFGPQFADAYSSLAALLAEQERFGEADDIYVSGIDNCPENSDLYNNYGVFLVDRGDANGASAHYLHAIQLNPKHYVAMVNLGRLLRSANKNKEAETWYKRALLVTRKVDVLSPLGALYYNTGRYEEALRIYKEAITMQPTNSELQLAVAQVLSVAGRAREAEKLINQVASERSDCLECQRLLSVIHSKKGNHKEALVAVKKAVQMKPKDPKILAELYFSEGNLLRELNRLDMAFESYKQAVELSPDLSQAWMNMGGIRHIKGDYKAAREYYEKALELVPNSKILRENLGKLDRLEKKLQGERRDEQNPLEPSTRLWALLTLAKPGPRLTWRMLESETRIENAGKTQSLAASVIH